MRRFHSAFFAAVVRLAPVSNATADDREVAAIVSKATRPWGARTSSRRSRPLPGRPKAG